MSVHPPFRIRWLLGRVLTFPYQQGLADASKRSEPLHSTAPRSVAPHSTAQHSPMKTVQIVVRGTSPLLMDKFNADVLTPRTRKVDVQRETPQEEAKRQLYVMPDGAFYIPSAAIARLLRDAGANHKQRGSRKSVRHIVPAAVRVDGPYLKLTNGDGKTLLTHFAVDSRSGVIPATKGRVMIHRPMFENWSLNFALQIDESLLSADFVRELLIEGGKQIGIGSFRLEKGGEFGAFEITEWR